MERLIVEVKWHEIDSLQSLQIATSSGFFGFMAASPVAPIFKFLPQDPDWNWRSLATSLWSTKPLRSSYPDVLLSSFLVFATKAQTTRFWTTGELPQKIIINRRFLSWECPRRAPHYTRDEVDQTKDTSPPVDGTQISFSKLSIASRAYSTVDRALRGGPYNSWTTGKDWDAIWRHP